MRRTPPRPLIVILAILACAALPAAASAACTTTWTGGSASWSVPGNWDNGLPDGTDTACVASGTVDTTGVTTTIGGLELSGGALDGSGDVTTGTLAWSAGDVQGSVTLTVSGAASIPGASVRTLGGSALVRLNGASTAQAQGLYTAGGTLEIAATLTLDNPNTWYYASGSGGLHITPTGTLIHTHAGTSTIGWPLELDGTARATAGELRFTGGGRNTSSGQLGGGTGTGAALLGGGTLTTAAGFRLARGGGVDGGTLDIVGAGALPAAPDQGAVTLASGAIQGTGTLPLTGLVWTDGNVLGSVTVTVSGAASITGASARTLGGSALVRLNGASTAQAQGLYTAGGTLEIAATLTLDNPNTWYYASGSGGLHITPTGTLIHTHAGTSTIAWPVTVDGTLDLRTGLLDLTKAPVALAPGALVQVVFTGAAAGSGYGQLRVPAGARLDGRLRGVAVAPFRPNPRSDFPVVLLGGAPVGGFIAATGFTRDGRFDLDVSATEIALGIGLPIVEGGQGGGDAAIARKPKDTPAASACDPAATRCYVLLGADAVAALRNDPAWLVPGDAASLAAKLCTSRAALLAPVLGCEGLRRLLDATGRDGLALALDFAGSAGACFGAYVAPGRGAVVDEYRYAVLKNTAFSWGADGIALPSGLRCASDGAVWRVAAPVFSDGDGLSAGSGATATPTRTARAAAKAVAPTVTLADRRTAKGYRLRLVARRGARGTILEATLWKTTKTGSQRHVYEFPLKPSALTVPATLAGGRLVAKLGRYGKLDLTLAGTGTIATTPPPAGCTGPGTRTRPAKVRGTLTFTPPAAKGAAAVRTKLRLKGGNATLADPLTSAPVSCPTVEAYDGTGPLPPMCTGRPDPGDTLALFQTAGTSPASIVQLRVRPGKTTVAVATTASTKGVAPARTATHTITSTARRAALSGSALTLSGPVRARLRLIDDGSIGTFASRTCRTVWEQSTARSTGTVGATYDLAGPVVFNPTTLGDGGILSRIRRH